VEVTNTAVEVKRGQHGFAPTTDVVGSYDMGNSRSSSRFAVHQLAIDLSLTLKFRCF
jgi:hypothetical protein